MKRFVGVLCLLWLVAWGSTHCAPPGDTGQESTGQTDANGGNDTAVAKTCFDSTDCFNGGQCVNGQCQGGNLEPTPDRAPQDVQLKDQATPEPTQDGSEAGSPEPPRPDLTPGPEPQGPEVQGPEATGPETGPEPGPEQVVMPEGGVVLGSISPKQVSVCSRTTATLSLQGTGFQQGAKVKVGTVEYASIFQSSQSITAQISLFDLDEGKQPVQVSNPDGSVSQPLLYLDVAVTGKRPKITALQPNEVCGTTTKTIVVTGTGFTAKAQARLQTVPLPTTVKGCNELSFVFDLSTAPTGTYKVEVCNPGDKCSLEVDLKVLDSSQCP